MISRQLLKVATNDDCELNSSYEIGEVEISHQVSISGCLWLGVN
jgi:hypothetical protein